MYQYTSPPPSAYSMQVLTNLNAIRLLKDPPQEWTPEDQDKLAHYSGAGTIAKVFDPGDAHADQQRQLQFKALLTEDEYKSMAHSTPWAFFTPHPIARAMWEMALHAGYHERGNILSLSAGTGVFTGLQPHPDLTDQWTLVEKDDISVQILRILYPEAVIHHCGFEDLRLPPIYDLVIDNVPYGDVTLFDPEFDGYNWPIHNHAIAKAVSLLKPRGLAVLLTSTGTLDSVRNKGFREWLATRCSLQAFRLPISAFSEVGTEVCADLLILYKRTSPPSALPDWVHCAPIKVEGHQINQNLYYHEFKHHLLGFNALSQMYGSPRLGIKAAKGESLEESLAFAIRQVTALDIPLSQEEPTPKKPEAVLIPSEFQETPVGTFVNQDGSVWRVGTTELEPITQNKARFLAYVALADTFNRLVDAQLEDLPLQGFLRLKLNEIFDDFTQRYGSLRDSANAALFREDSHYSTLSNLIDEAGNKALIFTESTIRHYRPPNRCKTVMEAYTHSLQTYGQLNLDFMRVKLDQPLTAVIRELYEQGLAFYDPALNRMVPRQVYLVGDIRAKLTALETADISLVESKPYLDRNREALEAVMPLPVIPPPPSAETALAYQEAVQHGDEAEIQRLQPRMDAPLHGARAMGIQLEQLEDETRSRLLDNHLILRLGCAWIPPNVYEDFAQAIIEPNPGPYDRILIKYHPSPIGTWEVNTYGGVKWSVANTRDYGNEHRSFLQLLELGLNLKDPIVTYENNAGRRVVDVEATELCRSQLREIEKLFIDWVWMDIARTKQLTSLYNYKFNTFATACDWDGSHLIFPGSSTAITPKPHQRNIAWRIMQQQATLIDHKVGAGKTFAMVLAAMEMKRLGMVDKPVIIVQKSTLAQFAAEARRLYPHGKFLVADKKALDKQNRAKFVTQMVAGTWDVIIMAHSTFFKIPISVSKRKAFIHQELDRLEDYKDGCKQKYIARALTRLNTQMRRAIESKAKDNICAWDRIGCDCLFVDECQIGKNLYYYTQQRNIRGLNSSSSQRSMDLFCKVRDLLDTGKRVIFASGTPITNTLAEMFTLQRYLQLDVLKARGIDMFDAWASTFGKTITSAEITHTGRYRMVNRFSQFYNVPELLAMYKSFADIKTHADLQLPLPKIHYFDVDCEPTAAHLNYMDHICHRADHIQQRKVEPWEDNHLTLCTDGRKMALDVRLVTDTENDFDFKVNRAIRNAHAIAQITQASQATQLIFCDLSTPKPDGNDFNVYAYIKDALIGLGWQPKQIAFIHDAKTEPQQLELFSRVNAGEVRFLLGSTEKLGTGVNVQRLLIAAHDLDCPYRPSDMDQRHGRIARQGNLFNQVFIFRYVTKGIQDQAGFDSFMYQKLECKSKFIQQIWSGHPQRTCIDVNDDVLSYAQIKALASGNPLIQEKVELETQVKALEAQYNGHIKTQCTIKSELKYATEFITQIYPRSKAHLLKELANPTIKDPKSKEYISLHQFERNLKQLEQNLKRYTQRQGELDALKDRGFKDTKRLHQLQARLAEVKKALAIDEEDPVNEQMETEREMLATHKISPYRRPGVDFLQALTQNVTDPWHLTIANVVQSLLTQGTVEPQLIPILPEPFVRRSKKIILVA